MMILRVTIIAILIFARWTANLGREYQYVYDVNRRIRMGAI